MTKHEIHRRFIEQLSAELDALTSAAKNSASLATDEAHRAESKDDTFSLENSYLARGQALRVEELRHALQRMQALPLSDLPAETPVRLGTLIRLKAADGTRRTLFFGPAAGGEKVVADGEEIVIVTARSPLGQALLGRAVGDVVELAVRGAKREYEIVAVE